MGLWSGDRAERWSGTQVVPGKRPPSKSPASARKGGRAKELYNFIRNQPRALSLSLFTTWCLNRNETTVIYPTRSELIRVSFPSSHLSYRKLI